MLLFVGGCAVLAAADTSTQLVRFFDKTLGVGRDLGLMGSAGSKAQQHAHLKVQEQPLKVLEVALLSGTMKELKQHPWYWVACCCQRWAGALTSRDVCSHMCNVGQRPCHFQVHGACLWSKGVGAGLSAVQHVASSQVPACSALWLKK